MDYYKISKSISDSISKISTPLTEDQESVLHGAVAVWFDNSIEKLLNPRLWSEETTKEWHKALPDLYKAFEVLRKQ